jgi:hypothetical protein
LGPRGPIPVLGWGREEAGEGQRRRLGLVAAAAGVPAVGLDAGGLGALGELG